MAVALIHYLSVISTFSFLVVDGDNISSLSGCQSSLDLPVGFVTDDADDADTLRRRDEAS